MNLILKCQSYLPENIDSRNDALWPEAVLKECKTHDMKLAWRRHLLDIGVNMKVQ